MSPTLAIGSCSSSILSGVGGSSGGVTLYELVFDSARDAKAFVNSLILCFKFNVALQPSQQTSLTNIEVYALLPHYTIYHR